MPIFQPRMLTGEYGYTLLKRGDVIEIWREEDDRLVHVEPTFLKAFQWAYDHPHALGAALLERSSSKV